MNPTQETVTDVQALPDRKTKRTVKWITALFILWFFYSLLSAVQFLSYLLNLDTYRIRMPDIFMIVLPFLMAVLLLAGLILFISKRRAGWNLLLFSGIYSLVGTLVATVRIVLLLHNEKSHVYMSSFSFVSQGITFFFFVICSWLLIMPGVLNIFDISKKSRNLAFLYSIAIVVAWLFLSQQIIFFLS